MIVAWRSESMRCDSVRLAQAQTNLTIFSADTQRLSVDNVRDTHGKPQAIFAARGYEEDDAQQGGRLFCVVSHAARTKKKIEQLPTKKNRKPSSVSAIRKLTPCARGRSRTFQAANARIEASAMSGMPEDKMTHRLGVGGIHAWSIGSHLIESTTVGCGETSER
jgi:hypothetical protein